MVDCLSKSAGYQNLRVCKKALCGLMLKCQIAFHTKLPLKMVEDMLPDLPCREHADPRQAKQGITQYDYTCKDVVKVTESEKEDGKWRSTPTT